MVFAGRQKCLNLLNFLNYRKNFALDGQSFSSVTLPKACLVMKLLLGFGKKTVECLQGMITFCPQICTQLWIGHNYCHNYCYNYEELCLTVPDIHLSLDHYLPKKDDHDKR